MKAFETPFVDVKKFNVEDILTVSNSSSEEEVEPVMVGENCF